MPVKPGKYIHFKGNQYEVIGTATHSETLEEVVVYRFCVCARIIAVRQGRIDRRVLVVVRNVKPDAALRQ